MTVFDLLLAAEKRDIPLSPALLSEATTVRQICLRLGHHKLYRWANELEKEGLPAKKVLNLVLESAEKYGYKWPVRYVIK